MTQESAILDWLKAGYSLTPLEALEQFGCLRLGARIHALREAGYRIESERVQKGRKFWHRYRMHDAP